MKLRIGSKDYDLEVLDRLTLAQTIVLDHELRGYPFATTLGQVKDLMKGGDDGDDWSRLVVTAVTVWSARALAGERMPLLDALDFPVADMSWIGDDGKEITGSPEGVGGKAAARRPPASGQTGNRAQRRAAVKTTTRKESSPLT